MKVERLTLREIRMRLKAPFETSFGVTQERRVLLVEVICDGIGGWGEITALESPSYNSETTDTAWHIVSDFISPLIVGRDVSAAGDVAEILAGIRGHNMAKGGVECALWDAEAKLKKVPLWKLLGGTRQEIVCGVSLGIRENADSLVARVAAELSSGYQRIKLKIKPGKDIDFVAAVRKYFPDILLSVDANSAYTLDDVAHLQELDHFSLLMIEQPLAWDDIFSHARLQSQLRTALCLDECINHPHDAESAIELHACEIINIKLGRVGGHSAARKVHDVCARKSVPVWCGGMLESGIGRLHNMAMSTLPGFTLPGDVSASSRYWDQDIVEPEVTVSARGTISAPLGPGIGHHIKRELIDQLTVRTETWTPAALVNLR